MQFWIQTELQLSKALAQTLVLTLVLVLVRRIEARDLFLQFYHLRTNVWLYILPRVHSFRKMRKNPRLPDRKLSRRPFVLNTGQIWQRLAPEKGDHSKLPMDRSKRTRRGSCSSWPENKGGCNKYIYTVVAVIPQLAPTHVCRPRELRPEVYYPIIWPVTHFTRCHKGTNSKDRRPPKFCLTKILIFLSRSFFFLFFVFIFGKYRWFWGMLLCFFLSGWGYESRKMR